MMNSKIKTYLTIPLLFIAVALLWSIVGNSLLNRDEKMDQMSNTPLISKMTTNIITKDVNRSIDFYKALIGFEVIMSIPDSGKLDFAILKYDEIELMLQSYEIIKSELPDIIPNELSPSFLLYFEVNDLNAIYERIRSAIMIKDKHQTFYGTTEFSVIDPDGYIIGFAQRIDE